MYGTDRQVQYAAVLLDRLYKTYKHLEAQLTTDSANEWEKAYAYAQKRFQELSEKERSWEIIDELYGLSADPEKAARQMRWKAGHPYWPGKGKEQNANREGADANG